MSAKAVREFCGKRLLTQWLGEYSKEHNLEQRFVQITPVVLDNAVPEVTFDTIATDNPWLLETKLVVKPDQLIKRRGKSNLLLLNASWETVKEWILERMGKEVQVEVVTGVLDHFIVEPFVPHKQEDEYYLCIQSNREGEEFLFHHVGGVDVGNVDAKALRLQVPIGAKVEPETIRTSLLGAVPEARQHVLSTFMKSLLELYRDLNFVYMEINPLVVVGQDNQIIPLDMAAKVDETAAFLCGQKWGAIEFPAPFGRKEFPEEAHIRDLDSKTGASLKLTILNHSGRIWTMVAGGGASVVYADTISDLGYAHELANYGEYSGAPSEEHTYEYARTILDMMTREKDDRGKVLIIGGGIANFTDVASTFKGIIRAVENYTEQLKAGKVHIWVRRGGPNYQEGLRVMQLVGERIGVPIEVYGPETHITAIVPMALGLVEKAKMPVFGQETTDNGSPEGDKALSRESSRPSVSETSCTSPSLQCSEAVSMDVSSPADSLSSDGVTQDGSLVRLNPKSTCIVYGLQTRAVQGMLDFDYLCKRQTPSVAALIFPFAGNHYLKFYWGSTEKLIPVYQSIREAVKRHPEVHMLINFSSFRSVYQSTMEALEFSDSIKTHAIVAEGVPESQTRMLIKEAAERNVGIVGPATVGGIKPGSFRIGNTGGMLDNVIQARLYRPGSVAYVSKSGGMSNELNNIIARTTDGVYEGVAIGGDKYPGSRFIDHLLRYQANPDIKILVLLGEVGGTDEYDVCRAMESGKITKPVVAWCIGTCAKIFPFQVQFGHAGACAQGELDSAVAKNEALRRSGAVVPKSFNGIAASLAHEYKRLIKSGVIVEKPEMPTPKMPMDYAWAKNLGLIRKPANFISSITDDRGEELKYAGMPISEVFSEKIGIGGVLGLLWFRRRLPTYATMFIEMILMVTADHGPAVSGAHNTIVTSRAGKDLISSLVSGLLTIGPRFGGALDGAAEMFSEAWDSGISPHEFVKKMRRNNKLIMGIGHRIKSVSNPDMRVTIIKEYAKENFPETKILDYALEVEKLTTRKKGNLILNVDGCIAVCFVDLLRSCGAFTKEEADEHIQNGCLNGLFVVGRSIGFIGHFLDQKRLKQPLYRHPWDDISYLENL